MSSPFDLQPWDTPSDNVSIYTRGANHVEYLHRTWSGAFCQRSWLPQNPSAYHLLLQRKNGPLLETIWKASPPLYLADRYHVGLKVFGIWTSLEESSTQDRIDLVDIALYALVEQNFSRIFYLNEQMELRQNGESSNLQLRLSNQGWGSWCYSPPSTSTFHFIANEGWNGMGTPHPTQHFDRGVLFYYDSEPKESFLYAPAQELVDGIVGQLSDEESDASFALQLAKQIQFNLNTYLWSFKNGDLNSFFEVLRLAFVAENEFWETRKNFHWQIQLPGKAGTSIDEGGQVFRVGKNLHLHTASSELQAAYKRVLDWFRPTLNEKSLEQHLSFARHYRGQEGGWDYRKPIFMSIQNPSEPRRQKEIVQWHKWLDKTS